MKHCIFLLCVVIGAVIGCVYGCTLSEARPPSHAYVLYFKEGVYVIYRCEAGYSFSKIYRDGIQWCDPHTGLWIGQPGTCHADLCMKNPCENGGQCSTAEDPWGLGYYCYCPRLHGKSVGGRHCQIVDPCNTRPCPQGTYKCFSTFTTDKGRYCFDKKWIVITEPEDVT